VHFLLDDASPALRREACGPDPSNVCRFVIDRTENVGLAKFADWITDKPLQILLIVIGAFILSRLSRRVIKRFANKIEYSATSGSLAKVRDRTPSVLLATGETNLRSAARAQTIGTVLRSVCTGVIWTFAIIYILGVLGLNLGPLLAGAGVAGVALGFGAQSLVKDFLSGTFMLIEDQFGVGDVVDLGEASGSVEAVSLRVTRLRDQNGTVWHVPNGQIMRVGNKSQQWARAVLDFAVAPNADLGRADEVIRRTVDAAWDSTELRPFVLDRPEVLGVEYLGPDAASIRMQGKTRPGEQWRVSRVLRAQVAAALEAEGIGLPNATWTRPPAK